LSARAALAALALIGGVTACGGTSSSPQAAALAYMRAHPVAPAAGMTAGIVLTSDDAGFFGAAAREAGCPAALTSFTAGAAGDQPACLAWSAAVEVPSGRVVTVSCGSIAGRRACPPALTAAGVYIPNVGDYVRFASSGAVTVPGDFADIAMFAVDIPDPDITGGPGWITTPATGGA
jgi:hypothetical protein